MKIGLLIYGSLETLSGGYLYDRKLVEFLHKQGEIIEIISLPWRNYGAHLADNFSFRLPAGLDLLIQDELNHPSLLAANACKHPYPLISLVHHLRCSEQHSDLARWFYRAVEKRYLRSVDGFIFNSNTTRADVSKLAGGGLRGVVANPPTDRFGCMLDAKEIAARSEEPGPLRLVFLGNLIPRKGLETILEAMRPDRTGFSLDVIGSLQVDPLYARRMQKLACDFGLGQQVVFHGALSTKAVSEKLKFAQVMVVPSSFEGFGIVYLEGMAFGLPAIGSTAGAASETITDGKTGYLIRPGDSGSLALRLASLAQDRGLLKSMSLDALDRYCRAPTWEQSAEKIRQFLYEMI